MQEELLLRQWTASHGQFSADVDRLIGKLRAWATAGTRARPAIGRAYAADGLAADPSLRSAANTLLSGLAAVATTALLFTAVVVVANPGVQAPGIASADLALASAWKTASSSAPGRPA